MKRRGLLVAAAGAAAGLAGFAVHHWRRPPETTAAQTSFWQSRFDRPEGGELLIASLRGQPVLLNFWGTWCPPCIKEMPELDRFQREWSTGRVVGLAVDNPTAVREYLARRPVSYTIGLAGFGGTELSRELGNDAGSLPFTVLFDRRGVAVQRKLGSVDLAELRAWVAHLG